MIEYKNKMRKAKTIIVQRNEKLKMQVNMIDNVKRTIKLPFFELAFELFCYIFIIDNLLFYLFNIGKKFKLEKRKLSSQK